MISLLFRIFVPASVAGYTIDIRDVSYAKGSLFNFYAYSLEFSTVDMTAVALQSGGQIRAMFDGPFNAFIVTNLYPFLYGIPRIFFPWKPEGFYDFSYAISAMLTGGDYREAEVGYASTIVGTSLILGGVAGVLIVLFALGVLVERVDRANQFANWTTRRIFGYSFVLSLVFHFFRQGTLGWAFVVGVVQQYGFVIGVLLLLIFTRSPRIINRPRGLTSNV